MHLSELADQALERLRGLPERAAHGENSLRNREKTGILTPRRSDVLSGRILEKLGDGRRWRARDLGDRLGIARDTAPHLRMLPGVELYDALAQLLADRVIDTDPDSSTFYLPGA